MGNVKLKNRINQLIEAYIFDHPFTMTILLQKKALGAIDVLYANSLAIQYFGRYQNKRAEDFFGEVWTTIGHALSKLHRQGDCTMEMSIEKDGVSKLFEMTVQQRSGVDGNLSVFVQLRERMDLAMERERRQEFQQKYLSVIGYNDEHTEKLVYISYHDQLTGLWNRRAMKEHFAEDSSYALKSDEKLTIIHLGLDRFKLINESLGHNGADEVLKMVAERLKMICPSSARLYRYGGDEFVVSLRNYSSAKTEKFAQKLLNEFGKPFYYQHQEYFISASIGISVYPDDEKTLESLIRKSDQALAFVKNRGRSHYRFYQKEMNTTFPDEALMESHLRRAIELNELAVHYQPQVDLKTGKISSFEALLRWNNRKFGFVSPVQFIPIAEDSGLIHGIGDWVLDQVCTQLKEWQDKQFQPVRIAVNISPKQFQMENFSMSLRSKIAEYRINPSSLEVEITESALTNMNETLKTINELKSIGVYISVDDFGTGYSSLSYLRQYPIDIIKIDRSFIKDIEVDEKNKAIAKTIINLAHNLGMTVVAEGVEKDLQAQILLEANCQKAQGFLYSKAVPVEEIVEKYIE